MKKYIEFLLKGQTIKFRPSGQSMSPKIKSKQLVTVEPIKENQKLNVGNIVLCKVRGRCFLHLISALDVTAEKQIYQISNNHGHVNGWCSRACIYGIVTKVED